MPSFAPFPSTAADASSAVGQRSSSNSLTSSVASNIRRLWHRLGPSPENVCKQLEMKFPILLSLCFNGLLIGTNNLGQKKFRGSGFVWQQSGDACIVLTVRGNLNLCRRMETFVSFENGETFPGIIKHGGKGSNLDCILVHDLTLTPVPVRLALDGVVQGDAVIHSGFFGSGYSQLHFSSGTVGVTSHNVFVNGQRLTRFTHCCSRKEDLIGGPVFNERARLVGVNHSKRHSKNVFFALDVDQIRRDLQLLFGKMLREDLKYWMRNAWRRKRLY